MIHEAEEALRDTLGNLTSESLAQFWTSWDAQRLFFEQGAGYLKHEKLKLAFHNPHTEPVRTADLLVRIHTAIRSLLLELRDYRRR